MIGRMSSDQIHQSGLNVILDAQAKLANTGRAGFGQAHFDPSDDPVASAKIQSVKSELPASRHCRRTLATRQASWQWWKDSVANVENLLMRARELAVRGANDSLSAQDQDIVATEIDSLRATHSSREYTKYNGDYIYGGFAVASAPYTDAGVNATFNGDTGVKAVNIAPGLTVKKRVVGSELFGQGSATSGMLSAFEALSVLSAGLRGNATVAHTSLTHDGTAVTQDEGQHCYGCVGQQPRGSSFGEPLRLCV